MRNPRTASDAGDAKFRIILNLRTHPCSMNAAFYPLPRRALPDRVYPAAKRHGKVMIP